MCCHRGGSRAKLGLNVPSVISHELIFRACVVVEVVVLAVGAAALDPGHETDPVPILVDKPDPVRRIVRLPRASELGCLGIA